MTAALRPIRTLPGRDAIEVIDQRALPFALTWLRLATPQAVFDAIRQMVVRGAPLIGASAACGVALQMNADAGDCALEEAANLLRAARPTAVNLAWAVDRMLAVLRPLSPSDRRGAAWAAADTIADDDVRCNRAIGDHALPLLRAIAGRRRGGAVNVLTHCNAGWLATVGWGTATAPIYLAHAAGLPLHVWVDETRPRMQGAALTAWELAQAGVPHTVIADNAGGLLMQRGQVDLVIVGCDRVRANGDVCNKVGTYLKALAAHDNGVPFYVAMPLSTLDRSGDAVVIEERSARELTHVSGRDASGRVVDVQLVPDGSAAANPAFDITPARLVTGLVTERGIVGADAASLAAL